MLVWLGWPIGCVLILVFMFVTCSTVGHDEGQDSNSRFVVLEFKQVSVPDSLITTKSRANYKIENYWRYFDFSDTAYIHLPEITEQALVDYLDLFPESRKEVIDLSLHHLLRQCIVNDKTGKMYNYFLEELKNYLYHPNSPFRNDEYYMPVLEFVLQDTLSTEGTKSRAAFNLEMMHKNRKNEIATDFKYTTYGGDVGNLYNLKTEYTILNFYDPQCGACRITSYHIQASRIVNKMLENKQINVLAMYLDEDMELWKSHQMKIPIGWINGRDEKQTIRANQIYDIRALPSLYLLDKDKKVLLKDVNMECIESYLEEICYGVTE